MRKFIFSLMATLALTITMQAQMTEGVVTMEVTSATSDDPEMAMNVGMLKGATTVITFKGDKSMTEMNIMGGLMSTKSYADGKANSMDMLIDAMGSKIWVNSDLATAKQLQEKEGMSQAKVTHDKSDTKDILGFSAHKVTVEMPGSVDAKVSGYITEEIKTDASVINGTEGLNLGGFPLEFSVTSPTINLVISATDIKKTVDESALVPVTTGYEKMTMDDLTKMMGGLSGGLGF